VLITGTVRLRPSGNENANIATGEIEVVCELRTKKYLEAIIYKLKH
jgi:aspartyl-tRNA synthetase